MLREVNCVAGQTTPIINIDEFYCVPNIQIPLKWKLTVDEQKSTDLLKMSDTMDSEMEERMEALGFKPQKEIPYNKLLPYGDKLDAESIEQLALIKTNLARTVQLRDIKFGASHWTGQLSKCVEWVVL